MQTELNTRPYQRHFVDEKEMAKEIADLEKLAQTKDNMDKVVENSNYSGAEDKLVQLTAVLK